VNQRQIDRLTVILAVASLALALAPIIAMQVHS